jgi:hypothetical protein
VFVLRLTTEGRSGAQGIRVVRKSVVARCSVVIDEAERLTTLIELMTKS